jgi:hypothetical protein
VRTDPSIKVKLTKTDNSHAASDTEALDTATAEMQAMFFFLLAQDRMPLPEAPRPLIRLPLQLPLRSRRAESYLAQLATDMGTEPSALQLLAEYGWRHTAVYL